LIQPEIAAMHYRFFKMILLLLCTSCAANVRNTDLIVSNTFLIPPAQGAAVFILNHNISGNSQVSLSGLEPRLTAKGYRIVKDRESAQFIITTNLVYCNQTGPDWPAEAIVSGGYGSKTTSNINEAAGGMASRVVGAINKYLNDGSSAGENAYACVADLQITDRKIAKEAPPPRTFFGKMPPAGVYQTRIGATVNQEKFDEKEAMQIVQQKLAAALAGYL
jgi:hypothetical protein